MTNRLEINWKLDGFVDEQRYYCSETHIDINNLPAPKVILGAEVRSYSDTEIEAGKKYFIRIGSAKNSIEKLSDEVEIDTNRDDFWSSVVSLIKFNGENGSIVFSDEKGFNWNRGGSTKISTDQSKFGGSSALFNGSTDYLSTNYSNEFNLDGGGDFTAECFIFCNNSSNSPYIFHFYSSNSNRWALLIDSQTGFLSIYTTVNNHSYLTTSQLQLSEWAHVAITRKNGVTKFFLNGILGFEGNILYHNSSTQIILGSAQFIASSNYFSGFIDSFRVTRGVCRYSENFTPPGIEFPNS
ncbi:LamG-like jellyroll fold domain-containing protein [Acinetobacter bereziniae]|uniref:LamG-like jellyroll fold domain-containing protein n=1 Tax=Acinetobacter bereziniae TaxID=106648 RepID=UPI00124FDCC0|nr:LamG-like jellyroll fold domain-containing protein [Acinetobacter bereziniae]